MRMTNSTMTVRRRHYHNQFHHPPPLAPCIETVISTRPTAMHRHQSLHYYEGLHLDMVYGLFLYCFKGNHPSSLADPRLFSSSPRKMFYNHQGRIGLHSPSARNR